MTEGITTAIKPWLYLLSYTKYTILRPFIRFQRLPLQLPSKTIVTEILKTLGLSIEQKSAFKERHPSIVI